MRQEAVRNAVTGYALDALAIGVIVTDRDARCIYANAAANRLLRQRAGALRRGDSGKVCAARLETQGNLIALISRTCAAGGADADEKLGRAGNNYILVPAVDPENSDLAICVLPFAAYEEASQCDKKAMMLVREIARDRNLEIEAQRLFGLSKAEARFASSLAAGLSLLEAARTHEVTLATARSHVKSIFRKTGLCRQSQVVALLHGAQIPVEPV